DNLNNNETGNHKVDNVQEDTLEDFDSNTWVAPSEMQQLPKKIYKGNLLTLTVRKTILQTEPKNKKISFDPPIMDKNTSRNRNIRPLKNSA
ncbi:hypothetical protein RhiirA4_492649, partial [Rhizophagus irregularis]